MAKDEGLLPEHRWNRARGLGWAAALWLAALYGSTPFVRPLGAALRGALGVAFSPVVSAGILAGGAGALLAYRRGLGRLSPGRRAGVALIGLAYAGTLALLTRPEERIHLVQYGVLGLLVTEWRRAAGAEGWWRLHGTALLLVAVAGAVDEAIQAFLPDRVGDPRDVALNAWAALLAVTFLFLLRPAGGAPRG